METVDGNSDWQRFHTLFGGSGRPVSGLMTDVETLLIRYKVAHLSSSPKVNRNSV